MSPRSSDFWLKPHAVPENIHTTPHRKDFLGRWGLGYGFWKTKKIPEGWEVPKKINSMGEGYFMNNTINHKIMTSQCKLLFSHRTDKMQPWGPSISSILQLLQAPLTSMNHLNNIKNIFNLKFYKHANWSARQPFSSFPVFFFFL